jgi:AcrR family transcriptional regulator
MAPRTRATPKKTTENGGSRKPRDREQRWDEIVEAAANVFYEKGYEGASLQDIASAVGLLKGSIYYYIDTKEDLLFELVMRAQAVWQATLEESDELAAAPAPMRLREFIVRFMQLQEQHREWGIVAEAEFKRLSPDYLRKVLEGRRRFGSFVEGIIQEGVSTGDFDDAISVPLATAMVFELVKSGLTHRPTGSVTAIAEYADAYVTLLVRGLGKADWKAPSATGVRRPATRRR